MKIIKKLSILLILYQLSFSIAFAQSTGNSQDSSEKITGNSDDLSELLENFYDFSLGLAFNLHGNDVGLGMGLTSPMIKDMFTFYLDTTVLIVDSKVYHPKNPVYYNHQLYQVYGLFKLGLQVAYTKDRLRAYSKVGVSMALVRDESWEDYYRVLFNGQQPANGEGPDTIWGIHALMGFEAMIVKDNSFFIEAGYNTLFGTVNPETSLIEGISDVIVRELNFELIFGGRLYF